MTTVSGMKAILAYYNNSALTWSNPESHGTPVIVTYSFSGGAKLDKFGSYYPASADYHKFTAAQQDNFRDATDIISAVSGIVFVEVSGRAMINVARGEGTGVGGYANYPYTGKNFSDSFFSEFVVDGTGSFKEGSYEFLTILHELGHAVGLSHPHEGRYTLSDSEDNLSNTLMTYNNDTGNGSYPAKLGTLDVKALKHLYGDHVNTDGWSFKQGADAFKITGSGRSEIIFGIADENSIDGEGGKDTLIGRDFDDVLIGGGGKDQLIGNVGDDVLKGEGNNDTLRGGGQNDRLFGGAGRDDLGGGDNNDKLYGGKEKDKLDGKSGDDRLFGQAGNDVMDAGSGTDRLFGGAGQDKMQGNGGSDVLFGGAGADTMNGGHDTDKLYGGAGDDTLTGASNVGGSDTMYGGDGADKLSGGSASDLLYGGKGGDVVRGGLGQDILNGGKGDDTLFGGDSNDTIKAGVGSNVATGGAGADTFVFQAQGGRTQITDFGNGNDVMDVSNHKTSFDDLRIINVADGARIKLENGDRIVLEDYKASEITASFFDF